MQLYQFLPILLLVVAFGAYYFWMAKKKQQMMADAGPAMQRFFEQTGYRYAHMPQAPIEEHVRLACQAFQGVMQPITYVRDYHGLPVRFESGSETEGNTYYYWCRWIAPFAQPGRVRFQIADKTLTSTLKSVKEAFSNTKRMWHQDYPTKVETGDPQLDARFEVFGEDPDAVRRVLATAGLKDVLLACAEVDLHVDGQQARLADPNQKNVSAGMGGTIGMMAAGFDIAKRMEATIPVHERMAQLLAIVVRAST